MCADFPQRVELAAFQSPGEANWVFCLGTRYRWYRQEPRSLASLGMTTSMDDREQRFVGCFDLFFLRLFPGRNVRGLRGLFVLIGRARRPSSIRPSLSDVLRPESLWLVAVVTASFHRRPPWLRKRLRRSIEARYGERHRMIPPDSRRAYRYVRGRVGRRRREVQ